MSFYLLTAQTNYNTQMSFFPPFFKNTATSVMAEGGGRSLSALMPAVGQPHLTFGFVYYTESGRLRQMK